MLAAGADPASISRGGSSPLDYLAARQAGDGHYRYSESSDQTPVWVTGQVLVAVAGDAFPIAPVAAKPQTSAAGAAPAPPASARRAAATGAGAPEPAAAPAAPDRAAAARGRRRNVARRRRPGAEAPAADSRRPKTKPHGERRHRESVGVGATTPAAPTPAARRRPGLGLALRGRSIAARRLDALRRRLGCSRLADRADYVRRHGRRDRDPHAPHAQGLRPEPLAARGSSRSCSSWPAGRRTTT